MRKQTLGDRESSESTDWLAQLSGKLPAEGAAGSLPRGTARANSKGYKG